MRLLYFNNKKLFLALSVLLISCHGVFSNNLQTLPQEQSQRVYGKIIDKKTQEIIPFCNIMIGDSYTGTSSNEEGEFSIAIDSLPVKITFSHISYQPKSLHVSNTAWLTIELEPLVYNLDEVLISKKDDDTNNQYGISLAKTAFKKIKSSLDERKYGRAFYRQKSKLDDNYTELSEIIYDVEYNNDGINKWNILEGRYAIKPNTLNNKNYTLFSKILKVTQPDTDDLIFLLNQEISRLYHVNITGTFGSGKNKTIILDFTPVVKTVKPIFKGKVFIDAETNNVLKISGTIYHDDLDLIGFTDRSISKKNYRLSYELAFKKDSLLSLILDYINVDQEFDYYVDDEFKGVFTTKSNLMFFEHYVPDSRNPLKRQFLSRTSDWEKLNDIGYNVKFWEENEIVKRTPVEKEVIESFTSKNSFRSIYLNSDDRISLNQARISHLPFIKALDSSLLRYNKRNQIEKAYLHTDRNAFRKGEELWYTGYIVLPPENYLSSKSNTLHVELIDSSGNIVMSQYNYIDGGIVRGNIKLEENLHEGSYILRAYTNWMRNTDESYYFNKSIKIIGANAVSNNRQADTIDLQFFPEGGNAIKNINGKIAFKAIGSNGLSVKSIKGKIVDAAGNFITDMKSIHNGAGIFSLNPLANETYYAILDNGSKYQLPAIENEGVGISVVNINEKVASVKIQVSESLKNKDFFAIGNIDNIKYYQRKFNLVDSNIFNFEIPKKNLPSGVMTLSILDENKRVWCERSLFINNIGDRKLEISTTIDKKRFRSRDKVNMTINVKNSKGLFIPAHISIAITDADVYKKSEHSENILTYLLLQSDVKGYIEDPGSYFADETRATLSKLDLVMLTHGWRRYNWKKIMSEQLAESHKDDFVDGISISGTAIRPNDINLINTRIRLIAKSNYKIRMYEVKTDSRGRFEFDNLDYFGPVDLTFSAFNAKGEQIDLKINLDEKSTAIVNREKQALFSPEAEPSTIYGNYLIGSIDSINLLKEVILKADKRKKERDDHELSYGIQPDNTVYFNDKNNLSLLERLSMVPGVQVTGSGTFAKVTIRGPNSIMLNRSPLWVVDGITYFNNPSDSTAVIPQVISSLNSNDIDRIEVLKGGTAAVYGGRGANGVILIYSKKGNYTQTNSIQSPKFEITLYREEKEFYSPKYDVNPKARKKNDLRTTLYWNPTVIFDDKGHADITFYTSDNTKNIQISIEGISVYGEIGAYLKTYGENNEN